MHYLVELMHYLVELMHYLVELMHYLVEFMHYLVEFMHYLVELMHYLVEFMHYEVQLMYLAPKVSMTRKLAVRSPLPDPIAHTCAPPPCSVCLCDHQALPIVWVAGSCVLSGPRASVQFMPVALLV